MTRVGRSRSLAALGLAALGLAALALAGCARACESHDDTVRAQAQADDHARATARLAGTRCLPAQRELTLELGLVGGEPRACASLSDAQVGLPLGDPLACWAIDLATGALAPRPPAILPGHAALVPIEHGCVAGVCIGPSSWQADLGTTEAVVAPSTDGAHLVLSTRLDRVDLYVVDRARRAVTRHITEPDGGAELGELAYVDDRIYRIAGDPLHPRTLTTWRDDGVHLDRHELGRDVDLVVLDATTLALVDPARDPRLGDASRGRDEPAPLATRRHTIRLARGELATLAGDRLVVHDAASRVIRELTLPTCR